MIVPVGLEPPLNVATSWIKPPTPTDASACVTSDADAAAASAG